MGAAWVWPASGVRAVVGQTHAHAHVHVHVHAHAHAHEMLFAIKKRQHVFALFCPVIAICHRIWSRGGRCARGNGEAEEPRVAAEHPLRDVLHADRE